MTTTRRDTSVERHRFDVVSFVFGVLFVGLALAALVGDVRVMTFGKGALMPVALIVAGVAIAVATLRPPRRRSPATEDPAPPDAGSV
jgi:uncharacterized membrane protein YoaK (UPF0700 family)